MDLNTRVDKKSVLQRKNRMVGLMSVELNKSEMKFLKVKHILTSNTLTYR